ncbi:WAT1-related protein At5g13670-like [Salvia splendens]|uniref:WAT1-related protein At5g13670-like n=1 Tax=Salvia splendens TaxID=180675 RepID=UPI001C277C30|nr:WAT1-related protein At5g13670-like [Salvia splendens]
MMSWWPNICMILVQMIVSVANICYKLAMNDGLRLPILVAYRFMFGAAFIVPVALFVEWKTRPKLTWKTIFYGLFGGSLGQNLYLNSLALTSATFATAMMNLAPATTFIVAICLRNYKSSSKHESVGHQSRETQAVVHRQLVDISHRHYHLNQNHAYIWPPTHHLSMNSKRDERKLKKICNIPEFCDFYLIS